jgi:hypothetical protein
MKTLKAIVIVVIFVLAVSWMYGKLAPIVGGTIALVSALILGVILLKKLA